MSPLVFSRKCHSYSFGDPLEHILGTWAHSALSLKECLYVYVLRLIGKRLLRRLAFPTTGAAAAAVRLLYTPNVRQQSTEPIDLTFSTDLFKDAP